MDRKGDSLSRGWILGGDGVVDIAQPELRFCRPRSTTTLHAS
jgi:hypothetical protein